MGSDNVTSTFCGTPQYFAPEALIHRHITTISITTTIMSRSGVGSAFLAWQVLESRTSRRGYDAACDLWSLGVILHAT